jgi:hypothetical protein
LSDSGDRAVGNQRIASDFDRLTFAEMVAFGVL